MLTRRLGNYGSFPAILAEFLVAAAPHGGWSEPQRSKVIHNGTYTYIATVSGITGDVEWFAVNEATRSDTTGVLHAALGGEATADLHDNPGLFVRSDGRLLAMYCRHADSVIRKRISVNTLAADPTLSGGFAAEVSVDPGTTINDYPNLLAIGSTLYCIYRSTSPSTTARWLYITSTDDGDTWSGNEWLYRDSGFVTYGQINGNGSRIDFVFQNHNEDEGSSNHLFHGYFDGTNFKKSDGTTIAAAPLASPLTSADLTQITSETAQHHLFNLEYDASGKPGLSYNAQTGGGYGVRRGRWTGSAWEVKTVLSGLAHWPPGHAIVPSLDRIYISLDDGSESHIWDYTTPDGGDTWSGVQISTDVTNLFPIIPRDASSAVRVMWMGPGTYTSYTNWNTGITVYGTI